MEYHLSCSVAVGAHSLLLPLWKYCPFVGSRRRQKRQRKEIQSCQAAAGWLRYAQDNFQYKYVDLRKSIVLLHSPSSLTDVDASTGTDCYCDLAAGARPACGNQEVQAQRSWRQVSCSRERLLHRTDDIAAACVTLNSHIPGYRLYIHPQFLLSALLPRLSRYFNLGEQFTWRYKYDLFSRFNSDLISVVSILPPARSLVTCDPETIAFIVKERKKFVKPLAMYQPLAMFGPNVGVTEGSEWTRHRRIVSSSNLLEVSQ
jgi:hypothetical protein